MALESIIAQRIAAAASARARLEASNFSLEPIREGLAVARGDQATAAALALRRDAMAQQGAEFEASQAGLPEPLARTLAPNILPPGADQGALDAVVSALGARGGANLLAKLAAYSAIWERDKAAAAANMTALLKAQSPKATPKGTLDAEAKDAAKRDWVAKYGPLLKRDPAEWPDDMLASAPPDIADNLLSAVGVSGRFKTRMAFDKAKWDAALSNMNADNARADALAKAGKDREARLARVSALAAVKGQIRAFEDEHGLRQKIETQNPDGSFSTIYRVDPSGLTDPDAKAAYRALLEQRDRLAGLVGEGVNVPAPAPAAEPAPAADPNRGLKDALKKALGKPVEEPTQSKAATFERGEDLASIYKRYGMDPTTFNPVTNKHDWFMYILPNGDAIASHSPTPPPGAVPYEEWMAKGAGRGAGTTVVHY